MVPESGRLGGRRWEALDCDRRGTHGRATWRDNVQRCSRRVRHRCSKKKKKKRRTEGSSSGGGRRALDKDGLRYGMGGWRPLDDVDACALAALVRIGDEHSGQDRDQLACLSV